MAKVKEMLSKKSSIGGAKKKSKYLCLDIGSHSIKGVVGGVSSETIRIDTFFEEAVPNGLYENGRISDREAFKTLVSQILSKNGIRIKDVIVTIDTSELIKREVVLPDVEDMDLGEAITYEIQEYLPINIEGYVLQPRVMEQFIENGQKQQKVLVAALPKEIVEEFFFALQEIGLTPWVLDIHSNALEKLFNERYMSKIYEKERSYVLVDLGHRISNVTILENGEYQFNRILRFGGESIDSALSAAGVEMSPSMKERIYSKSILDVVPQMEEADAPEDQEQHIYRTILDQLTVWTEDLEKVIAYYGSRNMNQRIEKICLYGGGTYFRDLDRFLERRIGIPVVILREVDNVVFAAEKSVEMFKYINALSALIRR